MHNGEVVTPILLRNEFVDKYLFKILYWNSRDFVSIRTLNSRGGAKDFYGFEIQGVRDFLGKKILASIFLGIL